MDEPDPTGSKAPPFSLRTKVVAVVLLSVFVPILVMGMYLLEKSQGILRERVRETLSYNLLRRTAQMEGWAADRLRDLSSWSTSFVLSEGVATLARKGRRGDAERARRDLTEFLLALQSYNKVYESLFIVDREGRILASTAEERLDEWGLGLLSRAPPPRGVLSPVLRSRLGRTTLLGLDPIHDEDTHTMGYLVGRINVHELQLMLASPSSDRSVSLWLLDEKGRFVSRGGKLLSSSRRERFPFALQSAARSDAPSTITPSELPGLAESVLYSVHVLEEPFRGYLVATLPASVAYRALHDSRNRLLAFGIPFVVLVLFLTYLVTRQVLQPIRRLSEGARRVSAGDLGVRLPERGHDEISHLTRVFNEMARRVEEARDALARSNEELTGANRRLGQLAITDGLTGLFNHRHFQDTLQREVKLALRDERPVTLLMLDLDHFKGYNDRWGHSAGDAALRRVADALRETLRETDLAFRYGGEEFTAILPGCDTLQGLEIAENLCSSVRGLVPSEGETGSSVTVSVGVASCPRDATLARDLLDAADAAMYSAKWRGRNCVVSAGSTGGAVAVFVSEL